MIKLNGKPINLTVFPDKTTQVWKLDLSAVHREFSNVVDWDFESESEIMHLVQLKTLLDHELVVTSLVLSYLPYARQDKPVSNDAMFGLASFAKIINSLNFERVEIMDPHSTVAKIIDRNYFRYPTRQLESVLIGTDLNIGAVHFLDYGVRGKYSQHYVYGTSAPIPKGMSVFYGAKTCDQATGNLSGYSIVSDSYGGSKNVSGLNVLIIDNICDDETPFCIAAKALYEQGAKSVSLFVTHGLFTKGTQPLRDAGIKNIFTKDGEAA